MGYGGVATVAVDVLAALTVLPALLAVLGRRVNALRIRRSAARPAGDETSGAGTGWRAASCAGRWLTWRCSRSRCWRSGRRSCVSPGAVRTPGRCRPPRPSVQASQALDAVPGQLDRARSRRLSLPRTITSGGPAQPRLCLAPICTAIDTIPGVTGAQVTGAPADVARAHIGYGAGPLPSAARHIVTEVRDTAAPPGATVLVGGQTAGLVDELASLGATLPWMALLVCVSTFVLMFLAFGSVVLPLKAIVMNVLSLSATFGVVVWIFQWGHLSGLLQFTSTGSIDPTMPILMLAIIFGLSMDYEVFLLSRIRERYDQTGDNTAAVAAGLQRTGGVITSLALLLIIVVGAFSASGITFIKLMGVGMIVALMVDATVVRVLLVPATMRLLGRANWWAPRPLRGPVRQVRIKQEPARDGPRGPGLPRAGDRATGGGVAGPAGPIAVKCLRQ